MIIKQSLPLVSILLPVHNSGEFLESCLKSLLSQSYSQIEIIAIDDKSRDKSFDTLKKFKKIDKRIRIQKNKKTYGIAVCLNRAIKQTKGSFIAFMDSKDVCSINRIKKQVQYLLSHSDVVAVGSQCTYIDEDNKRIETSLFPEKHEIIQPGLFSGLSMQFESAMINKTLLPRDILHFDTKPYPAIYTDIFMKIISYGQLANIPTVLQWHRKLSGISQGTLNAPIEHIKLWTKSIVFYDYRPSFRSLINPLIKHIQ